MDPTAIFLSKDLHATGRSIWIRPSGNDYALAHRHRITQDGPMRLALHRQLGLERPGVVPRIVWRAAVVASIDVHGAGSAAVRKAGIVLRCTRRNDVSLHGH